MLQNRQTFNDGILKVYRVTNGGVEGGKPVETLTLKESLRYHRRTVGLNRYYTAMQANQRVDAVLRCPLRPAVSVQDIVVTGGKQYRVTLIQLPEDIVPPVMDLTLTRLEQDYDLGDT